MNAPRYAVETPTRIYTFDTFDEASRFADLQVSSGHYVVSIYNASAVGPFTDEWRTGQLPAELAALARLEKGLLLKQKAAEYRAVAKSWMTVSEPERAEECERRAVRIERLVSSCLTEASR